MKKCNICKLDKATECFNKHKSNSDGFKTYCKECASNMYKADKLKNPEKFKTRHQEYNVKHKDKVSASKEKYVQNNLEKVRQSKLNWKRNNPNYEKNKKKQDPQYMLRAALRTRVSMLVSKDKKKASAIKDLGCTVEFLKTYLESLFQPGMTWDNYGRNGWHIDHIIPLSSFDLTQEKQLKEACYYTNLQPLWALDNLKKSNKIEVKNG